MSKPFKFKEFTIEQDRCAMKIGTDGVLLGAWASVPKQLESILDVGTGTGIISLMLAQRTQAGLIDALEIDENAYEQAVDNFENSPWGDRLFCYHAAFDEFVEEMTGSETYDLIISNPPFYADAFSSGIPARDKARFSGSLPFHELLEGVAGLLSPQGIFNVILPFREEESFLKLAAEFDLFAQRSCRVKGDVTSAVKRSMLALGFQSKPYTPESLTIENSRHNYTPEYKELVKDFYLNM